ncbi:hypothetical protein BGZ73_003807 [Actinomortierella ambigua]|nr:hypothetical protein BGZ73_003807 [Actinomortierella ambigua]
MDVRDTVEIQLKNLRFSAKIIQWKVSRHRPDEHGRGTSFMRWIQRQQKAKQLLQGITAIFKPGELTAILGGSGAGKTSLLNAMVGRSPPYLRRSGDIWFNGSRNPSLRKVNSVCAYVRQDDSFLLSHLTVRETLRYAAELSMARSLSRAEKWSKVEAIMELMGLIECAEVLVGSEDNKGCSGGQRRRVSIALQLVLEPSCLILDEPTTGLDAVAALALVWTLKAIARTGRTVAGTDYEQAYYHHPFWTSKQ